MDYNITRKLKIGHVYTVTASTTCTVTTAEGLTIITVEPGVQNSFVAPADFITFSDPDALVTETFKGASVTVAGGGYVEADRKKDTRVVDFGTVSENLDLSGYTIVTDDRTAATDELWLEFGDTAYEVSWPTDWTWLDGVEPALCADTAYCICVRRERNGRTIANLAYEYPVSQS